MQSGLFRRLSYRVHSANDQATVTFVVEESAISVPVIFENFVWFSDEQIAAAVRTEVPFFNGSAPAVGGTPEKIAAALQRLLDQKNIPGHVDFFHNVTKEKQELIFSVKGARVPVCSISFPGATAIPEAELVRTSQPLLKTEYSRRDITAFAANTLLTAYRRRGHLQAEFQPLTYRLSNSPQCAGGVDVTIPVEEGRSYRWAKSVWEGNDKLTVEDLANALGMNPGDLADATKIDLGLKNLAKAYGRRGYIAATVAQTVEFDDAASLVTYRFKIDEGARYFMGNLSVTGLPPAEAEQLKAKWTMNPSAVFDDGYLDEFRQTTLRDFVRGRVQRSPTSAHANVEFQTFPNDQKRTVDVVIAFK